MDKKLSGKTILKPVFITGVILLAVSLGFILWTFWLSRGDYSLKPDKPSDFHKKLILFDEVLRTAGEQGGVNHTHIANLLEALDESAVGAESRLSLLKRYRNLAKRYPEYFEAYREAAGQALKKFPHSALIAALSAEAALEAPPEAAVNQDSEDNGLTEKLKEAAFLLTENGPLSEAAFFPAAFCFYALSGEFKDINSALALKRAGELFTAFSASLPTGAGNDIAGRVRESMLVDAALVEIANGDGNEAAALARLEPRKAILPKTTDFIANYSYDFADPLLAAELWSSTGAEKDIARAASALYIAGDTENARKLWLLLAKDVKNDSTERGNAESAQRALYNLASITAEKSEKTGYAEQVLAGGSAVNRDTLTAALVLYTRLMPAERALDILSEHPLTKQEALPDIE
ncbi:MAG: hypothetical protein LBP37_03735, partial [Spirochaetaceae bacterium]|nr:hypothetical protein [Spirochaetaceae bacterium]